MKEARPQVNGTLSLAYATTVGTCPGFDRFGRVIDQNWQLETGGTVDRYTYGYDFASNRTWRQNEVRHTATTNANLDEAYAYDGLHRLTVMDRGRLAADPDDGISGTVAGHGYTLDQLGNWVHWDICGTTASPTFSQTRTFNDANQIDTTEEDPGDDWQDFAYDAAGNRLQGGPVVRSLVYDAWGRLVEVKFLTDTVSRCAYDGLGRRVYRSSRQTAGGMVIPRRWRVTMLADSPGGLSSGLGRVEGQEAIGMTGRRARAVAVPHFQ